MALCKVCVKNNNPFHKWTKHWFLSTRLGLTDISCWCRPICSICIACFVVWRPRRAADTSTNRRHGFLCRRTASMEQAADRTEAAAVDHYLSSSTENVPVPVFLWTPGKRLMIVLLAIRPRSSVRGAIQMAKLQLQLQPFALRGTERWASTFGPSSNNTKWRWCMLTSSWVRRRRRSVRERLVTDCSRSLISATELPRRRRSAATFRHTNIPVNRCAFTTHVDDCFKPSANVGIKLVAEQSPTLVRPNAPQAVATPMHDYEIGCRGNVPLWIEKLILHWLSAAYQPWKFGKNRSDSFWHNWSDEIVNK